MPMPPRLYAVIGIKRAPPTGLPYSTDPRTYGLNVFAEPVLDAEFEREYAERVMVYPTSEPAVDDIYRCGLEPPGGFLRVFAWVEGEWVRDDAETHRILEETSW